MTMLMIEYTIETHDKDGGASFFHEIALCSMRKLLGVCAEKQQEAFLQIDLTSAEISVPAGDSRTGQSTNTISRSSCLRRLLVAMMPESLRGKYEILLNSPSVAWLSDGGDSKTGICPSVSVSCGPVPQETLPSWLFADLLIDVGGRFFVAYRSFGAIHCRKRPLP